MYIISSEEWEVINKQFQKFVSWVACTTSSRVGMLSNAHVYMDVETDIKYVLLSTAIKYKKQIYMDSCYDWVMSNYCALDPTQISDIMFYLWKWRFRKILRSKSGTVSKDDDAFMVNVLEAVKDAPVDFRWSSISECSECIKSVCDKFSRAELLKVSMLMDNIKRDFSNKKKYGSELNKIVWGKFDLPCKPCYERPFVMDQTFHSYVKSVLVNYGNTYAKNYRKKNYVELNSIDLDSISGQLA